MPKLVLALAFRLSESRTGTGDGYLFLEHIKTKPKRARAEQASVVWRASKIAVANSTRDYHLGSAVSSHARHGIGFFFLRQKTNLH